MNIINGLLVGPDDVMFDIKRRHGISCIQKTAGCPIPRIYLLYAASGERQTLSVYIIKKRS